MLAYLVIREGNKWSDVFRLTPGRTVTLGRASTNQIVIKDDRCSRYHAEIFLAQGRWTIRDLESRNGTNVGGKSIRGDHPLSPGDLIRVANCQLVFVHDLSSAFEDSGSKFAMADLNEDTVTEPLVSETTDSEEFELHEPTRITHRRGQTKFLSAEKGTTATPRLGEAAAQLCRLAFQLANQGDVKKVAEVALEGLFEGTRASAGAVLLGPRDADDELTISELKVLASRSLAPAKYHHVSSFLAGTVMREGEAVLARNVSDDSQLGTRDSKGEIESTSVICAPVRQDQRVVGLVHLYSTTAEHMLDPEDLEFTLAVADNVALALKNLVRQQKLAENLSQTQNEIVQLRQRLGAESEIIGGSSLMVKLQQAIVQAAPSRATVLIRGESGVGKELVARAIHFSSPRAKGPFVCLNCAALSETLLESELFGHEKGAFTGATERKIGKFEAADRGTLMMDEIGEMSPSIQAKFLRALEGHPFERVGGNQAIRVDVRVIAATNRELEKDVAEGKFRRDLYFRLHVVEILVPPLRKRAEDVVLLAAHFLDRFNEETGKRIRGFTPAAIQLMQKYRWPGNVRELKNVIERAVVLARNDRLDADDLMLSNLAPASESGELVAPVELFEPMTLADMEKRHILATLQAEGWNKSRTAAILGIERSTLDRKIRRYQLTPDQPPPGEPFR
jgi:transcriptional regulator with GAF, ATPase, and Fis domain